MLKLFDGKVRRFKNTHRPTYSSDQIGTGKAFGYYLTECINNPKTSYHKRLAIVDADLATSCGINGAVKTQDVFRIRSCGARFCEFCLLG